MTTDRQAGFTFTGGFDDRPAPASLDDVRDLLSGSELSSLLMPGTISDQTAMQGSGIPIDKIRRGLLSFRATGVPSHFAITATTWAEVDGVRLGGVMVCTGRPVLVAISAFGTIGTSNIRASIAIDGVEITGSTRGLGYGNVQSYVTHTHTENTAAAYTQNATTAASTAPVATSSVLTLSGFDIVVPRPGPRRFAMVAAVDAGSGLILADGPAWTARMVCAEL